MKTFNIGDKIRVISCNIFGPAIQLGDEGVIETITKNPPGEQLSFGVVFPKRGYLHQICYEENIEKIEKIDPSSISSVVFLFTSTLKTLAGKTGSMYTEYNAEKKVFYLNFQDDMGEVKIILHNLSEEKFTKILELLME